MAATDGSTQADQRLLMSLTQTMPESRHAITNPTLVLFDTAKRDEYYYNPIIEIAKAARFNVVYYPINKIMDTPLNKIRLQDFNCAFFILAPEFLGTMRKSAVSQKMLAIIDKFSRMPKKITTFIFPSMKINRIDPLELFAPLFKNFTIPATLQGAKFRNDVATFFAHPIKHRTYSYQTALKPSKRSTELDEHLSPAPYPIAHVAQLPIKQSDISPEIKNLLPLGIYSFNQRFHNHLVVSSSALFNSGISEDFQICPIKFNIRKDMHEAFAQMMLELHHIATQDESTGGISTKKILEQDRPELPLSLLSIGDKLQSDYGIPQANLDQRTKKKESVAWMELAAFNPKNPDVTKQKKLIQFILDSQLENLWITINPNMYYSPIAKKKKNKQQLFKELSSLTSQLVKKATEKKSKLPSILIGFEITNNLYAPNLPTQYAQDLYGNNYIDLPRPLDKAFWENEVTKPLKYFLTQWKSKVSHGVQISGVILDLEMYNRKKASSFLSTMGFEQKTITNYLKQPLSAAKFINYLMKNRLSTNYFAHLEKKAEALGNNLRKSFKNLLPNGVIGCYAPNISINWFYKGLYRGLSTPNRPLHLLTFNTEFNSHKKWLEQNKIQARHSGVLMLSKIKETNDFKLVDHILKHNDGIWLNRFSRLVDKRAPSWAILELPRLKMEERQDFINYLGATFHRTQSNSRHSAPSQRRRRTRSKRYSLALAE